MSHNEIREKLEQAELAARGSKWQRLKLNPSRYLYGIFQSKLVYPLTKKGQMANAKTFFDAKIKVLLPASLDIYLLGLKSHDSELRLIRFLIKQLKKGDTFIDVGAHFGFFSLLAAKLTGESGKTVAFEAAPPTFAVLKENIADLTGVKIENKAVSNELGEIDFHVFPVLYSEYNSINDAQYEQDSWHKSAKVEKVRIPSITLDNYTQQNKITPNLVKIDVEGAEHQVISGMERLLGSNELMIVMEFLFDEEKNLPHHEALRLLARLGYLPYVIDGFGSITACPDVIQYLTANKLDSDNIVFKKQA